MPALSGMLFLGACNPDIPEPAVQSQAAAPSVPLETSINAVMVGLVDHASHTIWDAAVPEQAPKDDKAWEEIAHHAIQLTVAGSVIAMPGTGKSDAAWVATPEWQRYARDLAAAGTQALEAAQKKDTSAISAAGDKLVVTCEGCHDLYKGDLPTEGILHPH